MDWAKISKFGKTKIETAIVKYWYILLLLLAIPSCLALIRPGFFPTHDFIYVARIFAMYDALKDGQFPLRWVSVFRYGEPLFNFYAPLVYYLGSLIHTFFFGYLITVKILFAMSFILSMLTMFILVNEMFGFWPAAASSIVYLYAPYRSVDIYVRGALSEAWAFVFFPLVFWSALKLFKSIKAKWLVFLSLSLAGLFLTHNIMTYIFAPFAVMWFIYLISQSRNKKVLLRNILAASFFAGLLASSFLLPAIFEKKYIQTSYLTQGYFNFLGHFIALKQLFYSPWGYGASVWGASDGFSMQLGLVHWLGISIAVLIVIRTFITERKIDSLAVFLFIIFILSVFLQHNRSTFIWQHLPLMGFIQFPWRFLAVSVFTSSLIVAYALKSLPYVKVVAFITIVLALFSYVRYFHPDFYYLDSVDEHYIGGPVLGHDDKMPKDYLPIWVKNLPPLGIILPFSDQGDLSIDSYEKKSNKITFLVKMDKSQIINIPIFYYPGWEAKVDGRKITLSDPSDYGFIRINIQQGKHFVMLEFKDTPLRVLSNFLTFLGALILVGIWCGKPKIFFPKER
jgi:hypothetical protein